MKPYAGSWVLRGVLTAAVLAAPSVVRAQGCASICKADEYLSGENETSCFCTKLTDRRQLNASISAIDAAARYPGCVGTTRCNFFVARVGETREIPYFRDVIYPGKSGRDSGGGTDEGRQADTIYDFIAGAVASRASGWHAVSGDDAQKAANRGLFVVAVAQSAGGAQHGHVAIVVPAQMEQANDSGSAPWVRDAQSPGISRRANYRFSRSQNTAPIYAIWDPGKYY